MLLQRILSLVMLLFVFAALIVAASPSPSQPAAQEKAVVINNTKSLKVITAVRSGESVYLVLRNESDQTIMAYVVTSGNERFTQEFAYAEVANPGILAHATYELTISLPTDPNRPITIEAALLEGDSADGNPAIVQDVVNERLGERIQIERTLESVIRYLDSPNSKTASTVGELKSQIASELDAPETINLAALKKLQPTRESTLLPEHFELGLVNAKEKILRKLQEVETAGNTRAELAKLKELYERILRRL